jgi:phage terminase large subunit
LSTLQIPTAAVFLPLIEPARYLAAWGGRGSGKSHFFAELMIDRAVDGGLRAVCIREVQKSLMQSAKRLIEDKLILHGLDKGHGFTIYKDRIETPGDGLIMFQGMQDHTAASIKSLEGFTVAWVEESQTLSAESLKLLRPTIRGDGSQIWFSWNPTRKNDPVDLLFRQGETPTDSLVVKANWEDNPWFPGVLEQERLDCLHLEPEQYEHIWNGDYVGILKGAYFAKQMSIARKEDRICNVSADPYVTKRIFIDIGGTGAKSDAFSMWVVQFIRREIRVLDYYEAQGQELKEHLEWLRNNGCDTDEAQIWLPHDGATNDRVYRVSYETAFRDAGYRVRVIPNQGTGAASKRIAEVRKLFPMMWFNKDTTAGGVEALSWYHEKIDEIRQIGLGPDHDWSSHAADAFGLMCVAYEQPRAGGYKKPGYKKSMPNRVQRT